MIVLINICLYCRAVQKGNCSQPNAYVFPGDDNECNSVLAPEMVEDLGWDPKYGAEFSLSLDMITLMTAVSLNLGVYL